MVNKSLLTYDKKKLIDIKTFTDLFPTVSLPAKGKTITVFPYAPSTISDASVPCNQLF